MVATQTDQIFEDIVKTIREPLLILDQDLRVILASRSFYEFFKVTPEKTVGQLIYELGNKQWDIPKLRELLEIILPENNPFNNYEVEHDFASIGRRTMLLNARQIERAMGKERIILLAIEDITQRKQLEDVLTESLERYRKVFETSTDGILLFEKSGLTIRHANPAIEAMLGYSKEELVGNDLKDIGFPDDIGSYQEIMQTLNEVGILHYKEARIKKKTGQVLDIDIYMVEKTSLVQCILRDISGRKRSEEELNQIFSMSLDMICIADINTASFIRINPAFTETLGFSEEELLGKPFFDFIHPDDIDSTRFVVEHKLQMGAKVINFDNRYRCKDGSYRWLSWVSHPHVERGITYAVARDITERKQIEKDLKESKSLLDAVGRMARVGGWEVDGKTQEVSWTEETYRIHELPLDYKLPLRKAIDFFHPEDRERLTQAIQRALENGEPYDMEVRLITAKGTLLWTHTICQPEIANGKTVKLKGTFQDITDKKQADKALRESEEKYNTILENIEDGYYEVDVAGNFVFHNDSMCKILGYSKDELTGLNNRRYMDEENAKKVFKVFNRVYKTGQPHKVFDWELIRKDGSKCHVEVSVALKRDSKGHPIGFQGIARDITEYKRAEKKLRESEERYRMIFNNAPFGIMHFDVNGIIRDFNDNFTQIMAAPRENILGFNMLERLRDKEMLKAVKNSLDGQLGYYEGDYLSVTGGKTSPMRAIYQTIIGENGKFLGAVGLFEDITDRKRAEKKLRESEKKYRTIFENIQDVYYETSIDGTILEISPSIETVSQYNRNELVGGSIYDFYTSSEERDELLKLILDKGKVNNFEIPLTDKDGSKRFCSISSQLVRDDQGNPKKLVGTMRDITERKRAEKERKQLEAQLLQSQKMESIGNLAGGIAHDFNNILTSIIGFTELSLDEVEKGTHIEDNLQEVFTAGKRAKDLVRQILAFARQSEEEVKPIQVDMIATEVLKFIRSSIPTTIEIKQTIESDSLIMGNATQVHQVLMNLFTNASHAMEDEGGILELSLKDVVMDRGVAREKLDLKPGNYVEIKISDTGAGIAPEIIGSIFDPYFTTKGPGEGTGMGLAMVHGIIESYGGKISVDSKPGQGTLFTIYLPVTIKRQEYHPYQSETLPTGTERILFVDDEVPIAKMGGQTLEGLGYTVSIRISSIEALELFRSKANDFDLVITDMTMPNMTGDKLAVEMMKIRSDISVILCTGFSNKISDKTVSEMGIKAFAYKPIVKTDLAKTVRKVLDEAKTRLKDDYPMVDY